MKKIIATNTATQSDFMQQSLFKDEDFEDTDSKQREIRLRKVEETQKLSHTYFAHNTKNLDPTQLANSLAKAREVIGGVKDTCDFVVGELEHAGVPMHKVKDLCYTFPKENLPANMQGYFEKEDSTVKISFLSPTPKGFMYIGRNHVFVEDLARRVVNDTTNGGDFAESRAMVMETTSVETRTTVILMRVRSVIENKRQTNNQLVGEEMIFFGYRGKIENKNFISQTECKKLFLESEASGDLDLTFQRNMFANSLRWIEDEKTLREYTDDVALQRANILVEAFTKYRTYQPGVADYQVAKPVLPMDVMAAFVYVPKRLK